MMAQQVQQSEETTSTLATSSRTVLETHEEFKAMTGTIQLGRKLIIKYNRRELTDKLLIFLALVLFLATVLYILNKRLSFLLNTDQSMSNQYDARRETHLQP